ncbi:MAG: UvrD-helicase domain-containing protein [Xanthobacteraceae bacterium]
MSVVRDLVARTAALTAIDRSLLVEAGAGSGKTSVMAGRVAVLFASGVEPYPGAPDGITPEQKAKVDRLQAGGISCASIDGADEEVSETQICHCCRSTGSRAVKFSYRYATADSLWQQGGRSEAGRALSLGWMVCPTRS